MSGSCSVGGANGPRAERAGLFPRRRPRLLLRLRDLELLRLRLPLFDRPGLRPLAGLECRAGLRPLAGLFGVEAAGPGLGAAVLASIAARDGCIPG